MSDEGKNMSYNAHSYAVAIEIFLRKLGKVSVHIADDIEKNPLEYLNGFLNEEYEKSEEKKQLVVGFDDKYKKYKGKKLGEWEEQDVIQMIKDLREIFK